MGWGGFSFTWAQTLARATSTKPRTVSEGFCVVTTPTSLLTMTSVLPASPPYSPSTQHATCGWRKRGGRRCR